MTDSAPGESPDSPLPTASETAPSTGSDAGMPTGLLLAAGSGSRFDPQHVGGKLLAPLRGVPIALIAARKLLGVCRRTMVVIRPEWAQDPALDALRRCMEHEGIAVTICATASAGMGHSLAWGIEQSVRRFDSRAVMVALADMPFIDQATLDRVAGYDLQDGDIVAPSFRGERGHPVVFGRNHFTALRSLTGDRGAGPLLRGPSLHLIETDDPGVLRDVDRPEELGAG